jgi:hypothetical protein
MSSFRKPYTVIRSAPGSYVDGYWVEGAETNIVITASVQPLKVNEIEALPEGKRSSSAVKIYTDTKLLPAKQATETATATSADMLQYSSSAWEIVACASYQSGVISHYKAYAVEVME